MKVAIDSGPLSGGHAVRGIGVMVREQIAALNRKTKKLKNLKIDSFDFSTNYQSLITNHYDIVHYPYFFPYALTLPSQKQGRKMIVTIQDLIHLIYPKHYPSGIRGKFNFFRQKQRLKNVDAVITISETSKKDIVRFLGIPADKIHVVHLAPKNVFKRVTNHKSLITTKRKYSLPDRFVLYVGDVNYNKNIPNLIKACKLAKLPLVICGKQALEIEDRGVDLRSLRGPKDWIRFLFNLPHPELAHYNEILEEFKKSEKIIMTGFVPDEDLVAIYNLASVYVQPSFYEGFGLPVLEALACGTPVVISRTNALIEIAGNAALRADPNSPKDIADKITEILKNPSASTSSIHYSSSLRTSYRTKEILIEKGFERVKEFSWEKTAREIVEVYKLVASD